MSAVKIKFLTLLLSTSHKKQLMQNSVILGHLTYEIAADSNNLIDKYCF